MTTNKNDNKISYVTLLTSLSIAFALATGFFDRAADSGVSSQKLDQIQRDVNENKKSIARHERDITENKLTIKYFLDGRINK